MFVLNKLEIERKWLFSKHSKIDKEILPNGLFNMIFHNAPKVLGCFGLSNSYLLLDLAKYKKWNDAS